MLNKKIEDICNRQIEREGYSSELYLSMASWAENSGLSGVAGWMYTQSDEERLHMLKFIKYINERGGKAIIPALKKPPVEFKNAEEVFKEVLKHEEFVMEQVEEEASARQILDKLRLVGKNNMYEFDRDIVGLRRPAANTQATP
jgi:ferritin